uniref:Uncharacterized protein n=1 Tax=Plectus sambesii TaxID=2011161 RepID=A0A914VJG4_9BILA
MASTTIVLIVAAVFITPSLGHGGRKGGFMRCGLPPFADSDKLSVDVKEQLKSIWANYVEGADCSSEREQTKALIQSLPEDVRQSIRPMRPLPPCGLPPFLEKLPADMQQKVQAIWANYVQGEDCKQQHKETRELLKTLTKEQKKALRPFGGRGGNRGEDQA